MPILINPSAVRLAKKIFAPKQDNFIVSSAVFIVIVSPVTRHKLVPEGSTTASMPPTVTVATMPILTNTSAVRLAKKILPRNELTSCLWCSQYQTF